MSWKITGQFRMIKIVRTESRDIIITYNLHGHCWLYLYIILPTDNLHDHSSLYLYIMLLTYNLHGHSSLYLSVSNVTYL